MKIKINLRPIWKSSKGHPLPLSGAGVMNDKRTKRKRTRSARNTQAIRDQSDG